MANRHFKFIWVAIRRVVHSLIVCRFECCIVIVALDYKMNTRINYVFEYVQRTKLTTRWNSLTTKPKVLSHLRMHHVTMTRNIHSTVRSLLATEYIVIFPVEVSYNHSARSACKFYSNEFSDCFQILFYWRLKRWIDALFLDTDSFGSQIQRYRLTRS